ncbi:MAG: BamA/TamA family outer membrane protein [Cyclobacteriaceae bacterium]|nr:BamA/TamA family outer membrane protein [Cyclobacteriaceae bacterium]
MKLPAIVKVLILSALFLHNWSDSVKAQSLVTRYFNQIFNDTSDIARPQFIFYPTLAYAPETSWEIGFSSLLVYFAKGDTSNRLSEINGFSFITLENQYGIWFDHALYSDKDKWFFLGRLRLQSFPLFYHGTGPSTPPSYLARVDANQIIIKERVLRKLAPNFFTGIEADFHRLSRVAFISPDQNENFQMPLGSEGTTNIGLGMGIVYDNRHNVLNVRDGIFSELALLRYSMAWGSNLQFTSVISDNRIFKPIGKNNVLAAQVLGQFNMGNVPFNQMALMGGESLMRGYYLGRYRDKNQLAAQAEYRMLPLPLGFSKRIGAAVFASAGTVFEDFSMLQKEHIKYAGGAGLRFLLFPKKDIYTRLDFAMTKEGHGFYLFIGEAF